MPKGYGYDEAPKKAAAFKMKGYTYPGEGPIKHTMNYGAYTSEEEKEAAKEHNRIHAGKVPGTKTRTIKPKKKKEK
tara:strand:- start:63 stop:290 length:228 start_codon:yes stop_codon:yes gene_type:complete